jgi:hypothetical protein
MPKRIDLRGSFRGPAREVDAAWTTRRRRSIRAKKTFFKTHETVEKDMENICKKLKTFRRKLTTTLLLVLFQNFLYRWENFCEAQHPLFSVTYVTPRVGDAQQRSEVSLPHCWGQTILTRRQNVTAGCLNFVKSHFAIPDSGVA